MLRSPWSYGVERFCSGRNPGYSRGYMMKTRLRPGLCDILRGNGGERKRFAVVLRFERTGVYLGPSLETNLRQNLSACTSGRHATTSLERPIGSPMSFLHSTAATGSLE